MGGGALDCTSVCMDACALLLCILKNFILIFVSVRGQKSSNQRQYVRSAENYLAFESWIGFKWQMSVSEFFFIMRSFQISTAGRKHTAGPDNLGAPLDQFKTALPNILYRFKLHSLFAVFGSSMRSRNFP